MCVQLGSGRGERLGVLQSRREVVPEHWGSRPGQVGGDNPPP